MRCQPKHTPVFTLFFFTLSSFSSGLHAAHYLAGRLFVCLRTLLWVRYNQLCWTRSHTHMHPDIGQESRTNIAWNGIDNKSLFEFEHMRAFDSLTNGWHCTPISSAHGKLVKFYFQSHCGMVVDAGPKLPWHMILKWANYSAVVYSTLPLVFKHW